jgi:hypothetical protein
VDHIANKGVEARHKAEPDESALEKLRERDPNGR